MTWVIIITTGLLLMNISTLCQTSPAYVFMCNSAPSMPCHLPSDSCPLKVCRGLLYLNQPMPGPRESIGFIYLVEPTEERFSNISTECPVRGPNWDRKHSTLPGRSWGREIGTVGGQYVPPICSSQKQTDQDHF